MFRRGITIAIVTALPLLAAANALAGSEPDPRPGDKLLGTKGGIAYVADPEVSSASQTTSYATCPKLNQGWRIAGGGVRTTDKNAIVFSSRPLDIYLSFGDDDLVPDDYWESIGTPAIGKKLTTYAICMKEPKLKYETVTTPSGPTALRSAVDSCPGKTRPTGGGGFIATTGSYISSIYPSGKSSWGVSLLDVNGGNGGMTNNFVCLKAKHTSKATKKITVAAGKVRATKATCKGGAHVTGGGLKFSGHSGDGKLISSYPIDGKDADRVPDDGWKVQGYNQTAGDLQLKAFAICRG